MCYPLVGDITDDGQDHPPYQLEYQHVVALYNSNRRPPIGHAKPSFYAVRIAKLTKKCIHCWRCSYPSKGRLTSKRRCLGVQYNMGITSRGEIVSRVIAAIIITIQSVRHLTYTLHFAMCQNDVLRPAAQPPWSCHVATLPCLTFRYLQVHLFCCSPPAEPSTRHCAPFSLQLVRFKKHLKDTTPSDGHGKELE